MTTNISPRVLQKAKERFRNDPNHHVKVVQGVECEDYQKRILSALIEHDRIAISACHDLGKTFIMARGVLYFGSTFPSTKIITTAPTNRQVEKILWAEIKTAYARAKYPLGGRMLQTEWKLNEEGSWFAMGFSPSNQTSSGEGQGTESTFQGFHAGDEGWLIVVFDEATGVRPALWTMAEGLMTSARVKFICIGNPTSTQSEFYKCFSNRAWHKIKLSCFDSPNLIANGITNHDLLYSEVEYCRTLDDDAFLERMKSYKVVKGYLLTLRWVVEKALDWGMDSPLFLSKVLGEFPEEGDNVAIPLRVVEEAQRREYVPNEGDRKCLGVDVARFGSDSTVLTGMHGYKHKKTKRVSKRDTMNVVGEVIAWCKEDPQDIIVVDETGLGAGVVDRLIELRNEGLSLPVTTEIRGVQFGAAAAEGDADDEDVKKEKEKYVNLKARMFDLLAKDMRSSIALMDEEVYQAELPSIQYRYNSKGQMCIESKDEYKKRTGRSSPDHADSLALANYGRYEELTVGSFTEAHTKARHVPRSWSKKGKPQW